MLKEMIVLVSYGGFNGGAFGNLLSQWDQMGVFSYMLPFLLMFALTFGILTRLNLFGNPQNRSINAIISLSVSLMALQFGMVTVFFQDIFPRMGVALAGLLVFLILIGLFGNPYNRSLMNTLLWGSFGVAVLIVLQSTEMFRPGYYARDLLGIIPLDWIPWIALIVVIALIVGNSVVRNQGPQGGHAYAAFGGQNVPAQANNPPQGG